MVDARTRVFVHLDHGRGLNAWALRYANREVLDPTPYNYGAASDVYDMAFSVDKHEGRVSRVVRKGIRRVCGFDLVHAIRNFAGALQSDVIWTHTENEHLALSALLLFMPARRRPKLIAQSIWLWDDWARYSRVRRFLYTRLLRVAALHTAHSPLNLAIAHSIVGSRAVLVPYGASGPPKAPRVTRRGSQRVAVLGVGNDRDRNWQLLIDAARYDPDLDVRVLSTNLTQRGLPPNITVFPARSIDEVASAYAGCEVVAVPLHPNKHASGLTVLIESLASDRPVLASNTGGLSELLKGGPIILTDATDGERWAAAIRLAASGLQGGPEFRESHGLTQEDYVNRHVILTEWLMWGTGDPAEAARLRRTTRPIVVRGAES